MRFGQFTLFMPLLLKPAPTRLRLVLSSLHQGREVFPEAPPPGLVTIPVEEGVSRDVYTEAGYRSAGARAIRIDMLERLADLLRAEDTRSGFEATPDMLSITGMTLEQFADLLQGLGYAAERGEREKMRAASAPASADAPDPTDKTELPSEVPSSEEEASDGAESDETSPSEPAAESDVKVEEVASPAEPEVEVYYVFRWAPKPRRQDSPRKQGAPKGKGKPVGKRRPSRESGPKTFHSKPSRKDKIDPDNPFAAALMGLKDKS